MANELHTGVLKEGQSSSPVNQDVESETNRTTCPHLTETCLCRIANNPQTLGGTQATQLSNCDVSPTSKQRRKGEEYDLKPLRYNKSASPSPPTNLEEAAPQQLFSDPMNYGYDQPETRNQIDTHIKTVIVKHSGKPRRNIKKRGSGPDLTIPAIFACILCCWPIGMAAIYYASTASSMKSAGDVEGARSNNKVAGFLIALSVLFWTPILILVYKIIF